MDEKRDEMFEFKQLTRDKMYAELKRRFPELAVGESRANKDRLIQIYGYAIGRIAPPTSKKMAAAIAAAGVVATKTGRFSCTEPNLSAAEIGASPTGRLPQEPALQDPRNRSAKVGEIWLHVESGRKLRVVDVGAAFPLCVDADTGERGFYLRGDPEDFVLVSSNDQAAIPELENLKEMVEVNYTDIELRILAALQEVEGDVRPPDLFSFIAARLYNVDSALVTSAMRTGVKAVLAYHNGNYGGNTDLPHEHAALRDALFEKYPRLSERIERESAIAAPMSRQEVLVNAIRKLAPTERRMLVAWKQLSPNNRKKKRVRATIAKKLKKKLPKDVTVAEVAALL